MRRRDYFGILFAMIADGMQFATTAFTLGTDQFAIPVQVIYSVVVSAILALVMKPSLRLLPGAVLEVLPITNLAPGFTGGALWVALSNRKANKVSKPKS
jgi:hypothetical protein